MSQGRRRFPARGALLIALALLVPLLWLLCSPPPAEPPRPGSSLGLSRYSVAGIFPLPIREASAVAYDPGRDSLLVLTDHGDSILEVDRRGAAKGSMSLDGFQDTEGMTWTGDGDDFFVAEEGNQFVVRVRYVPGAKLHRGDYASWVVGPNARNSGLEGISFDPASGILFGVKERKPRAIYEIELGPAPQARVRQPFDARKLRVGDLADIQVLSTVGRLAGTQAAGNLLLLSQESARLLEVDRQGDELDSISLGFFSGQAEGVTVDPEGNLFVVGESSRRSPGSALLVLAPPTDATQVR